MIILSKNLKKIRLQLKSFNYKKLLITVLRILSIIQNKKNIAKGPVSLPTKKRIYCLLRSPHINKKSREHFEIRSYTKILEIYIQPYQALTFFLPSSVNLKFLSII
uniref:Ribosomal protein S10 n=1 Tax=Pteridomonas sp. YPF1301 TaxID=2766739 RepID=A0A7G1MRX3_9STRA|nr:ribosomal protein S10 [Pteridomonas sp. YPF1301]